jgi:nucleoside-diphosphate-sugar epimerase
MRILVTGAAGFIGSHIAEALADKGHDVAGVDNLSPHYATDLKEKNVKDQTNKGVSFHRLDLVDDDLTSLSDEGVDAVVHAAAQPGISSDVHFDTYIRNNKTATHRLLEFLKEENNMKPHVVNISSSSVYGLEATGTEDTVPQPASHYGVTKLGAEQLVMTYHRQDHIDATSLRLFSVYGPRERPEKLFTKLIHAAETEQAFPLYEGSREHVRSFTFIGDVVDGVISAIDNKQNVAGEIINIGNDKTNTTGEAIAAVENAVGKKIEMDMQPPRAGDQSKTAAKIAKAKELLNYNPKTNLEEGVKAQVEWFRDHKAQDLI